MQNKAKYQVLCQIFVFPTWGISWKTRVLKSANRVNWKNLENPLHLKISNGLALLYAIHTIH